MSKSRPRRKPAKTIYVGFMSLQEARDAVRGGNRYLQRRGSPDGDPSIRMGIHTKKTVKLRLFVPLDDPPETEIINLNHLL